MREASQEHRKPLPLHPRLFVPALLVLLAGLLVACQPLLLNDDSSGEPTPASHGSSQTGAAFSAPEIAWGAAPPCPAQQNVCAHLLYRLDDDLREIIWSGEGLAYATRALTDVPHGFTSFSPDYTRLVVQTPSGHTAGGPLYLYNLETEELHNLNDQVGLPNYSSLSALRVAGWSQDSQNLLLVNEDDEVTIWLDLVNNGYRPLALGVDTSQQAPPRRFVLAPDGNSFTFISVNSDAQEAYLYYYDIATDENQLILTVPFSRGRLTETAISPNGEQLAYLLLRGNRVEGRSQELHVLELNPDANVANADRLLLASNLGPTSPVWSPDSERIALIRRDGDEPLRPGPNQPPPRGDIWTVSTTSGEVTRVTFTEALNAPPVWSPGGAYLAFTTVNGQVGMVAADGSGEPWRMDAVTMRPQFTRLAFVQ